MVSEWLEEKYIIKLPEVRFRTLGITRVKFYMCLAVVSAMHMKLGDYMQGKITEEGYIRRYQNAIIDICEAVKWTGFFKYEHFKYLFFMILLISLADVKGAWKTADDKMPSKTFFKELYMVSTSDYCDKFPSCYMCKKEGWPPWKKYRYSDAAKIVKSFTDSLMSKFELSGTGLTQGKKYISLTSISKKTGEPENIKLKFDVVVIDGRTSLYKAIGDTPSKFASNFKSYRKPTWVARNVSTPMIYLSGKNNHIAKLRTEPGKKLFLLRMDTRDNHRNINILFKVFMEKLKNETGKMQLARAMNRFNLAFADISSSDYEERERKGFEIERKSNYEWDMDFSRLLLCKIPEIDGYISPAMLSDAHGGFFHEEVMLCYAGRKTDVERIVDTRGKNGSQIKKELRRRSETTRNDARVETKQLDVAIQQGKVGVRRPRRGKSDSQIKKELRRRSETTRNDVRDELKQLDIAIKQGKVGVRRPRRQKT
jgi:hypothetical protein